MEAQPNNPLHGVTLEQIVKDLVSHYGWEYMGYTIKIKCLAISWWKEFNPESWLKLGREARR